MADCPKNASTFNTPLESAVRILSLLVAGYPATMDEQQLVCFDYLVVHSNDAGGPESLHPPLPMRSAEILVRHDLIRRGLLLLMSRGLTRRINSDNGFLYQAEDLAGPFMDALITPYSQKLKARASWVADNFGGLSSEELKTRMKTIFDIWTMELQHNQQSHGVKTI